MTAALQFSLNRISAPRLPFSDFLLLARQLEIGAIEIRNDLPGVEITDGTPAATIKAMTEAAGIDILTINALQRFEQFDAERAREAIALARFAAECGAKALVLCPTNSLLDRRSAGERHSDLVAALEQLKPILSDHGLLGFVETLGFEECALRRKSDAVRAIADATGSGCFKLVHDTFHHHLASEDLFFPELTGLVHISGVQDPAVSVEQMRDGHRVLVGPDDRLGNVRQLATLFERGYRGHASFEPFSDEIAQALDVQARLRESIAFIRGELGAACIAQAA